MVLEEGGFFVAQCLGNVVSFFFGEDDAVELFVDDVVLYFLLLDICRVKVGVKSARCRKHRNPARLYRVAGPGNRMPDRADCDYALRTSRLDGRREWQSGS